MRVRALIALSTGALVMVATSVPVPAGPGKTGQSGVTFQGGVPGGGTPGPALPTRPTQPTPPANGLGPGYAGNSDVTFGGGVPGGFTPGPALPSPSQKK
jgi:hypothetical protein